MGDKQAKLFSGLFLRDWKRFPKQTSSAQLEETNELSDGKKRDRRRLRRTEIKLSEVEGIGERKKILQQPE